MQSWWTHSDAWDIFFESKVLKVRRGRGGLVGVSPPYGRSLKIEVNIGVECIMEISRI